MKPRATILFRTTLAHQSLRLRLRVLHRTLIRCLFLLVGLQVAVGQRTIALPGSNTTKSFAKEAIFHSKSLDRDMHYLALLPRSYGNGKKFPVLYLLHGLYGDYKNWDTLTKLEIYAKALPMIIVMPDADDSWYTNSAGKPKDRFEEFIANDMIAEVDNKYQTIPESRARAIAGLSMGGYGAIKFALKYPDRFIFAGSLSGALDAAQDLDALRPEFRAKLLEVFGNAGSETRARNDIFSLLKSSREHPYFYLACGTDDFFLSTDRAFVAELSAAKIAYEYHETPGGHTWEYWDAAVQPLLKAVESEFASPGNRGQHP